MPKLIRPVLAAVLAVALTTPSHAFLEEHVEKIRAAIAAGEAVQCPGCNLSYADLSGLDLTGADMQGAYMYGARMQDAIMR
ncbi:MAG: pentapeptide repeat-containing protein, partial [Alphaproteobacteria bacterium]|nr:pentapeptide repeat-containing protein [Alphaproteobacteria bacterium]